MIELYRKKSCEVKKVRTVTCKRCQGENILTRGQKYTRCEYCGAPAEPRDRKKLLIGGISALAAVVIGVIAIVVVYMCTVANVTADGVRYKKEDDTYIVTSFKDDVKLNLEIKSSIKGKPVVAIADEALADSPIISVTVPGSVKKIGKKAFADCDKLTVAVLLEGVTDIDAFAFYHCDSLQSAVLPKGLKTIGASAFYTCKSLKAITIPDGTVSIGATAFAKCCALEALTIENGITEIPYGAFEECTKLEEVALPASVYKVDRNAFYRCAQLKTLNVSGGVKIVYDSAFEGCENLTDKVFEAWSHKYDEEKECWFWKR